MNPKLGAIITVIICRLILAPYCLMLTWNAIAWEFNFPQFSFWIPFGILLTREFMKMKVELSRKD